MPGPNNQIDVFVGTDGFAGYPEVEELTGKSQPTIIRWWNEGLIPAPEHIDTPGGKRIFLGFRRSKLKHWAENPAAWIERHRKEVAA